jgi:hypothetical protein
MVGKLVNNVQSRHYPGGSEENYGNPHSDNRGLRNGVSTPTFRITNHPV